MKNALLGILFGLVFAVSAVAATPVSFAPRYVANDGSDTNDCLSATQQAGNVGPCATMQNAVNSMEPGGPYTLQLICNLAAGQECGFAPVNIAHFKFVAINGDCSVAGFGRTKIVVPASQAGIWAQDHATATVQCVAFEATGNGAIGFALRQYAIGDCAFCWFRSFPGGTFISAQENSKFNAIANIYFMGNANHAVNAGDFSTISMNTTVVYGAVAFAVNLVAKDSKIFMSGASIANGGPTGIQWSLQNGILEKGGVTIPGSIAGSADGYSIIR